MRPSPIDASSMTTTQWIIVAIVLVLLAFVAALSANAQTSQKLERCRVVDGVTARVARPDENVTTWKCGSTYYVIPNTLKPGEAFAKEYARWIRQASNISDTQSPRDKLGNIIEPTGTTTITFPVNPSLPFTASGVTRIDSRSIQWVPDPLSMPELLRRIDLLESELNDLKAALKQIEKGNPR